MNRRANRTHRNPAMPRTGSNPNPLAPPGKLIALDVGLSRIGVAVCDPLQLRARPVGVLVRASRREDFDKLAEIMRDEDAKAVICGLPLNMDGTEGKQAATVRKWAMRLAHALRALLGYPVPIIFWDERLSTYAASEYVEFEGMDSGEDALAASIILQRYLERHTSADIPDYGRIVLPPSSQVTTAGPGTAAAESESTLDHES